MSLQQRLSELEREHSVRENSLGQFEHLPQHLVKQVSERDVKQLEDTKREIIFKHLDEYTDQRNYLLGNENLRTINRIEEALLQFAKRTKEGDIRKRKNGSIVYQRRHSTQFEFPALFNEIEATIGSDYFTENVQNATRGALLSGTVGVGLLYGFLMSSITLIDPNMPVLIDIINATIYGSFGVLTGTAGIYKERTRFRLAKPEKLFQVAKNMDQFLVETIKPYLNGNGPYR